MELGDSMNLVGYVVQHEVGEQNVERAIRKRQGVRVRDGKASRDA